MRFPKTQTASAPLTESEKLTHLENTQVFLDAAVATDKSSMRKAKLQAAVPYQATCDWIHEFEKVLLNIGLDGFVKFCNKNVLVDLGLMPGILTGVVDTAKLEKLRLLPPPAILCPSADQEQKQITACNYMEGPVMELTMDRLDDFSHRYQNDKQKGIREAGLQTAQYHSMVYMNLEHGNYNTALNKTLLEEHVAELHEQLKDEPNHPALLEYWPDILRDRGHEHEIDDAIVGLPARRVFCTEFKTLPCFTSTAEKVGLAKWRTWEKNTVQPTSTGTRKR